jgi:protein-S-isoprenylcysteine O-methyltransferase Ste14
MEAHSLAVKVVISCWIVFVASWLLAALSTKRTVYRESGTQRLRYWVLLLIAYLFLTRGRQLPSPLNMSVLPHTAPVACTGALLCVAGLGLALWARVILGRNWSGVVTLKEGHELVERGPYRFVRHPIYAGILTMVFASALVLGHVAGFVGTLLMFVSFWIKLGHEEKLMLQQFPERYAAYQQRAKRLIPFLL